MNNQPMSLYEQILRAESSNTVQEIVDKENSKRIRVHMPAKVVKVNGATVDVEIQGSEDSGYGYYTNFPQLLDLPIIYNNYTSSAYIITPIQVGDTGLVEFLDFNSSNFQNDGNTALSTDSYYHSLNNGTFINGFIPTSKHIDIPSGYPIIIGLHNNTFSLTVSNDGTLEIKTSNNINLSANNININSGNTTIDGYNFKNHKHGNGNQGNNTTGVVA